MQSLMITFDRLIRRHRGAVLAVWVLALVTAMPFAICITGTGTRRRWPRSEPRQLARDVVEGEHDLAMDRRPVVGVGRLDDDIAVEAHLLAVVLADVRVLPVDAGVGERHPGEKRSPTSIAACDSSVPS
jgi:hypothetical protein